ncbi:MAG: GNAT family N-acetyltransferase [Deltaproteobacteria bacterium]|nr:GNAT family N-acetyltransferase [Deltaproteobacteria bacterium]
MRFVDVDARSVDRLGFFCCMSKKKSEGYQRKLRWVKERFSEGMRVKLLELPERGFIEYLPGEHAWRPVQDAEGWLFVHCLWVVGRSKGKGFGEALLGDCLAEAKKAGARGVAMIASEGNWLAGRTLLERQGFESVDEAGPSYSLMIKAFKRGPLPSFPRNWDERLRRLGKGVTVVRTDQCPYLDDAARHVLEVCAKLKKKARVLELGSAREVHEAAPSPYGTFAIVDDGRLVADTFVLEKDLLPRLRG